MIGNFKNNLDEKNRVLIPAKLRVSNDGSFYISPGLDKALTLRSEKEYKTWSKSFLELPTNKKDVRKIQRAILGNTYKLKIDKIGRINIPPSLLEMSEIKQEIVFIGLGKRIEIFAVKVWDEFMKTIGKGILEDSAENLEGFDI